MTTAFFTAYDSRAADMANGMIRSVKKFYPDIPMIANVIEQKETFDLKFFCESINAKGKELLEEYDRIIYIDPDSIMCGECPDLFGEFDLGVVENNISVGASYGGVDAGVYINNGLVVCTSKEAWQAYTDAFNEAGSWSPLNHQNALNNVAHTLKFNTKLLEFPDKVYGISCNFHYHSMIAKDGKLYVSYEKGGKMYHKQVLIYHAAGPEFKDNLNVKFDCIEDLEARELLRSFTL